MFLYMSYICVIFNLIYFSIATLKMSLKSQYLFLNNLVRVSLIITHITDWQGILYLIFLVLTIVFIVSTLYWLFVHHAVVYFESDPLWHILTSVIGKKSSSISLFYLYLFYSFYLRVIIYSIVLLYYCIIIYILS